MGGGKISTKADWPQYLKAVHENWLGTGVDYSITDLINTLQGNNPFDGELAYNPVNELLESWNNISIFKTATEALNYTANYSTAFQQAASSSATINTDSEIEAYSKYLNNEVQHRTLPEFKHNMLQLNAVNTSSFIISQSIIHAFKSRRLADYARELRLNKTADRSAIIITGIQEIIGNLLHEQNLEQYLVSLALEAQRIAIVGNKEALYEAHALRSDEALWDIEAFQHGANLIASIHGSTVYIAKRKELSQAVRTTISAASYAATGALIGLSVPVIGPVAGAAIGLLIGIGVSFL